MKRKKPYLLAGLVLLLFLLCTACGNTEGQIAPQDDPNEGLGGGLSEDTVNDFSGFEGIWLGEADNDYDSMEFDAEGNWTLYLSGEVVDDGYLRYEPEWEAIYAYRARTIPAASSPWRKASSTAPLTATLTTAKGWSTSGMRTAAISPRTTSPIPRRTRCPTGTAV